MAYHLSEMWNKKKCTECMVLTLVRKKYCIFKARDETFIELGEILFNLWCWRLGSMFIFFPSLCKAHCVLLILSSSNTSCKKEKKNVNRKINAKYNFFWGVYLFPSSLPYFFSNLVCMPVLCVSLQTVLEFWQKKKKKSGAKKGNKKKGNHKIK